MCWCVRCVLWAVKWHIVFVVAVFIVGGCRRRSLVLVFHIPLILSREFIEWPFAGDPFSSRVNLHQTPQMPHARPSFTAVNSTHIGLAPLACELFMSGCGWIALVLLLLLLLLYAMCVLEVQIHFSGMRPSDGVSIYLFFSSESTFFHFRLRFVLHEPKCRECNRAAHESWPWAWERRNDHRDVYSDWRKLTRLELMKPSAFVGGWKFGTADGVCRVLAKYE